MLKIYALIFIIFAPVFNTLAGDFSLSSHVHRDNLRVGYETAKWDYREYDQDKSNEQIMKDSGTMKGFTVDYSNFISSNDYYWFGNWNYLSGNTVYDGQYSDGTAVKINTQNSISSFSLGLGKSSDIEVMDAVWDLSIALNGRLLKNANSGVQGDYSREISYTMIPVHTGLDFVLSSGNIFGLGLTYNHLLIGNVKSNLGEAIPDHPSIENKQDKGKSLKFEAQFTFVGEGYSFTVSPYYRIYQIEDSDVAEVQLLDDNDEVLETRYYYEPANTTKMTGLNLTINF
ncbi:MAG: hypothetical protein KC493_00090 [Bacteriovoracaceae bacterium]|nr:hypothetical protein [Bacteriovoracaceae bacterium]